MKTHHVTHAFGFLMLTFTSVLVAILMTMVSENKDEKVASGSIVGDVVFSINWDAKSDVDLWAKGPKDEGPVGYSRRSDKQCSYLVDNLGYVDNGSTINWEVVACRSTVAGLYVVNLHLYSIHNEPGPVKVTVTAKFTPVASSSILIYTREVELVESGQEATAFSFELDQNGKLVDGSVSTEFIPLRSAE